MITKLFVCQVNQSIATWLIGATVIEELRQGVADAIAPAEVYALVHVTVRTNLRIRMD